MVDEVEAVRIVAAGSLQGAFTTLRREPTNPAGNGWANTLSVMKLMNKILSSRHLVMLNNRKVTLHVWYHRLRWSSGHRRY